MNIHPVPIRHPKSISCQAGSDASQPKQSTAQQAGPSGFIKRLVRRVAPVLILVAVLTPAIDAQRGSSVEADACSEMLALLQVDSRGDDGSNSARCDQSVNLRILLMASPFRGSREKTPSICVPPDSEISLGRVAEIFYGYGSQYLDSLYENPFALLIESLEEEFPCPSLSTESPPTS